MGSEGVTFKRVNQMTMIKLFLLLLVVSMASSGMGLEDHEDRQELQPDARMVAIEPDELEHLAASEGSRYNPFGRDKRREQYLGRRRRSTEAASESSRYNPFGRDKRREQYLGRRRRSTEA